MKPTGQLFVNQYCPLPGKLRLYFAGETSLGVLCWAWALMDTTDIYASDRGTVEPPGEPGKPKKVPNLNWYLSDAYPATAALGRAARWLKEQGWTGELDILSHQKEVIDMQPSKPLMA